MGAPAPSFLTRVDQPCAGESAAHVFDATASARGDEILRICGDVVVAAADCDASSPRASGGSSRDLCFPAMAGLARAALLDAFHYASRRRIRGKLLLEHELIAARLSMITLLEMVCSLRLGELDFRWNSFGLENSDIPMDAEEEIRRSALRVVSESAHVFGGHGFAGDSDPRRRIEAVVAILAVAG